MLGGVYDLTLRMSGRLTRFHARGRRNKADAPDARPRGRQPRPLERVVRRHDVHLGTFRFFALATVVERGFGAFRRGSGSARAVTRNAPLSRSGSSSSEDSK